MGLALQPKQLATGQVIAAIHERRAWRTSCRHRLDAMRQLDDEAPVLLHFFDGYPKRIKTLPILAGERRSNLLHWLQEAERDLIVLAGELRSRTGGVALLEQIEQAQMDHTLQPI